MNHFVQRLGKMHCGRFARGPCVRVNMPVAARPIRAPQAGIGKAHPCAEHDDRRREQRAGQSQPPEPEQPSLCVHALAYGGEAQQALHVFEHALGARLGRIEHHEIAERIDQVGAV